MQEPAPAGEIWVVDDSPLELEVARRALAAEHRIEAFTDGTAMLERLASREPPDALVLDWVMPGLSGVDICRFLRSKPETAELPVLILTALQETGQVVEGLGAGANDYVRKPYATEELAARAGALVRTRRLRLRAERAEATVRGLLANLPDPLLVLDGAGTVGFANLEAQRTLGKGGRRLVGERLADLLAGSWERLEGLPRGGEALELADVAIGGRTFAPIARTLPGAAPGTIAVSLRDVTQQRELEARRLDFYSTVAHDLRAPLAAMSLRLDVFAITQGRSPGPVEPDVRQLKSRVREMLAMVDDFLGYARLEGGPGYAPTRGTVSLAALSREVIDELGPLAERGGIAVSLEADASEGRLQGDARRLRQVISNLLSNAIKFTPAGGRVRVAVGSEGATATLKVIDTGRGIAPEIAASLFGRYVRALDIENDVSGTGLGLMIVKQIVEAHGGSVGVESAPGAGSTFWVRLPANDAAARRLPSPPPGVRPTAS